MKIKALLRYQMQIYFKGVKFVMPMTAMFVFLFSLYDQKPLDIASGFLVTGVFLFFVMAWTGMSVAQNEDSSLEQILYLKMNDRRSYDWGKQLFLIVLALLWTAISILIPIVVDRINGGMFIRPMTFFDVIHAFFIIFGSGVCGAFTGCFLHPRVVKDRKFAFAATGLICVLGFAKTGVALEYPFLKWVLWIFPPVSLPMQLYGNAAYFDPVKTIKVVLLFGCYSIVYGLLKNMICHRKGF